MNDSMAEDTVQTETEVKQIVRDLYETLSQGDFGPWMNTLHDPAGRWLLGKDVVNIREASEGFVAAWSPGGETPLDRQEIDDLEIRVTVINPTLAFAVCTSTDRRWYFVNGQVDRASTAETWVFFLT